MASAGVKAVRELRDEEPPGELVSRSVPALNGAAHLDDDDNSVARRLYTESERDLLDGLDTAARTPRPYEGVGTAQRTPRPYEGTTPEDAEREHSDADYGAVASDYGAVVSPERAASPTPNLEQGLVAMLRESLPYWGQGMEDVERTVREALADVDIDAVNAVDADSGETPLLLCAQYGAGDLVDLLVTQGAEVNATLPSGAAALHYMTNAATLDPAAVKQLLLFGADPNVAEQHTGATPLHYAADAGATDVCQDLVRHGADVALRDFGGYDAAGSRRRSLSSFFSSPERGPWKGSDPFRKLGVRLSTRDLRTSR